MKDPLQNNGLYRRLLRPWTLSLVLTLGFFAINLGLLHPGYAINDDLKIISILAGYPGNNPAPFPVFSNVLLGLMLVPLYSLHTAVNWEIWLFSVMNFLSVWALLHILLSGSMPTRHKLFGASFILACAAYFALNITFTSAAALACLTGICLILDATRSTARHQNIHFVGGIALILLGSLVRIEMLALVLPLTVPALVFIYRSLNIKNLVIAVGITGLVVASGYVFDRLYVRAHPNWHAYYVYNKTAQMLQDAHRLENLHRQIRRIGWSGNDQELFARSFFPDAGTYSLDHIRYLVEHVPGTSQNPAYSARAFITRLGSLRIIPFLLTMASIWLWSQVGPFPKRSGVAFIALVVIFLAENLGLVWAYKDPDYVLLSSLASTMIVGVLISNWLSTNDPAPSPAFENIRLARIVNYGFLLITALAVGLLLSQYILTSNSNVKKQTAYRQFSEDLKRLQQSGKIAQDALIVSPAHGLPIDWSNPLILEFPSFAYFDTGWITFSPSYEGVLQKFGIQSLPDAFYQKDNIYLMTKSAFTVFLSHYYQEHENVTVEFRTIYAMPNTYDVAVYNDVRLYKVVRIK